MATLIANWLALAMLMALVRRRQGGVSAGLVTTYLVSFFMVHVAAAALYLIPEHEWRDPRIVQLGFQQAVLAMWGLFAGCLFAAPALVDSVIVQQPRRMARPESNLPAGFVACGVFCFLASATPLAKIPSATAILSTGQNLVVAGLGLSICLAWRLRNMRMLQIWAAAAIALPGITLLTAGFLGYGTVALFTVLVFVSQMVRNRLAVVASGLLVGYIGVSVFVTYARDRDLIREQVWGGAVMSDRIGVTRNSILDFEWFNPANPDHRERIDNRLNQNYYVGLVCDRMGEITDFAKGATITDALLALVPRALWPDKPMTAGSGSMVSDYTGLTFAGDTSVGVGQVMELYINFGGFGVLCGFFFIGTLLGVLDTMAGRSFASLDFRKFVVWYLPGLSLLQIGGSLMEITTGIVASAIVARMTIRILDNLERRRQPVRMSRARVYPR